MSENTRHEKLTSRSISSSGLSAVRELNNIPENFRANVFVAGARFVSWRNSGLMAFAQMLSIRHISPNNHVPREIMESFKDT